MKIGTVKEIKAREYRVGLTPNNVHALVSHGHSVLVERGAGLGSGFSDEDYEKNGAMLIDKAADVWAQSEMIVKVKEPLEAEYLYFRKDLILFTYLHLAADKALTDALLSSGVKAFAYETLVERDGSLPLLIPMSQIAGRLSVQEGAKYLEKTYGGAGVLLSGVPGTPRARVLIVGAGCVGMNACKIAVGMGAEVTIIDINVARLAYIDDIFGSQVQTLISTPATIAQEIARADLVIGAVLIPGKAAPKLITHEHLASMRPGSVFVDVAVDQGGCAQTTHVTYHDDPIYTEDGVVHYCVGNMPGSVPRTSTIALTNATERYALQIADYGLEQAIAHNPVLASGVNCYEHKLTCKNVADSFEMEYTPLESLLT